MPKYVIERNIPRIGEGSDAFFQWGAAKSNGVLRELGPDIQWLESFVTPDKMYCIYRAPDLETIQEHARRSGFPAHAVSEVHRIIDPTTAEGQSALKAVA